MILKVASATALSYGHPFWLKDLVNLVDELDEITRAFLKSKK